MITVRDAEGLGTIHSVMMEVVVKGRKESARMTPISYLLRAHDLKARQEEDRFDQENPCPPPLCSIMGRRRIGN